MKAAQLDRYDLEPDYRGPCSACERDCFGNEPKVVNGKLLCLSCQEELSDMLKAEWPEEER